MDRDYAVELNGSQLRLHGHDPRTERCPVCGVAYCPPYAEAAAQLPDASLHDPAAVEVRAL